MEPVMKCRYTKTYDNATKHTHLKGIDTADRSDGSTEHILRNASILQNLSIDLQHTADGNVHYKISDHGRKSSNLLFLLCHSDRNTYCKK